MLKTRNNTRLNWRHICVAALCIPTMAFATPEEDLANTLQQLRSSQSSQKEIKKKIQDVTEELARIQTASVTLAKQIQEQEADILTQETRLEEVRKKLQTKEIDFTKRERDVGSLIHAMIRMQRMPRQMVVAQSNEVTPLLRTASALNVSYSAVESEIASLSQDITSLNELRSDVIERRNDLQKDKEALISQQRTMQTTLKGRQTLQNSLSADHAALEKKIASLSHTSGSLQSLIQKLEKESALFQKVGIPQAKPEAPERNHQSFAARKGALPYPAVGKLIHRYGEKKNKNDKYMGHVLQTGSNAQVTAPHQGTVVFSGKFMDYGNMIIIQHDKPYHTLIAGLSDVLVSPGQNLEHGEPVGVMGATLSARSLYFELRKNSKAIDPSAWMGNVVVATR